MEAPPTRGKVTDRRLYRFESSPCSETKLDAELAMFESRITRMVSDHLSSLIWQSQASPSPTKHRGSSPMAAALSSPKEKPSTVGFFKRKRSRFSETHEDVQGEYCGWTPPLKLVVRKGFTMSDVGELGRIIIPKKGAETLSFPQIDTKEGAVLEMEDYCALKRWRFRLKYWINNKSRMYVLENTGEFVRYHSLREHDVFVVYEDGCKNLVVRGQKQTRDDNLIDDSKGSALRTLTASATEEKSGSRTANVDS